MALLTEKGFCCQNAKKVGSSHFLGGPKTRFDFAYKRDYYIYYYVLRSNFQSAVFP